MSPPPPPPLPTTGDRCLLRLCVSDSEYFFFPDLFSQDFFFRKKNQINLHVHQGVVVRDPQVMYAAELIGKCSTSPLPLGPSRSPGRDIFFPLRTCCPWRKKEEGGGIKFSFIYDTGMVTLTRLRRIHHQVSCRKYIISLPGHTRQ